MKSQDILLLLKLVSLYKLEQHELQLGLESGVLLSSVQENWSSGSWQGWEQSDDSPDTTLIIHAKDRYSVRNLEAMTGISKSEISASLKRSVNAGLASLDRKVKLPRANNRALKEFIVHGLKYVFPAEPGKIVRGIPTSLAAPVMAGKLMTAGDVINVWPDPTGKEKGQSILPLFKSVPKAVKQDPELYKLLALVDAIRLGNARETQLAVQLLDDELQL
ncbi:hypothetical protein [Cellvibrio sp. NN19]|uniref:hypothetical protein n=1 Tax=Cellvibrio chitinivorans TaxID=3102792 RepID=UPI002B40F43B|nr:hypothetical protein [Cellvibrio sp. NN19]